MASGDVTGAVAALQRIVGASPKSFDARLALGSGLDLEGLYPAARRHLEEALKLATDQQRTAALTALGISYAFESKADEAARYYQRAEQWYTTGFETSRKIPDLPADQAALWEMRRHNAFGRIEARRGNQAEAAKHADAVKELLNTSGLENQRVFYPYLLGYIAFFGKDYRQAIAELTKGDQSDPFVLGLIAQSYQRLGDRAKAGEFFRKVMETPAHNINSAFSRPLARAFLR
jgi:tetratricopeptide (TPR) repeat protein